MGYLYILLWKVLHQGESMLTRRYARKYGEGGMFFNAIICLCAMIFFILSDRNGFYFPPRVFLYGIISALMFALGFYSMFRALQLGPYMLTTMIVSFSGVIFLLYALLYLKETATPLRCIAIVLSVLSAVVIRLEKTEKTAAPFSVKWLFWVVVCLLSNGVISILNREQQRAFAAACDNEFMILSLCGSSILLLMFGFLLERHKLRTLMGSGAVCGLVIGLFNGAKNYLHLIAMLHLPILVISPVGTGINLVLSFLVSVLLYKETFTRYRLLGTLCGVAALLLMAIK